MHLFSLKNKVAVVTGGYGHLGEAMTKGLAEAGATVFVGGRNIEKFQSKFETVENIEYQELDISSTDSIRKAFKQINDWKGSVDILINNAVYSASNLPEKLTDEDWNMTIDGTLSSVFRCIREVAPYMKNQKRGKIINISSMYGVVSPDFSIYDNHEKFFNPPNYGAAKAAVIQLTRYYAAYYAKYNINVNCISPGPFPTPEIQRNVDFVKQLENKNPQRRIGHPDDLKGIVIFLASEASSYITGQNINVDGGWTIW
jgi:NAD(P)-dependent dehydrogenase (short-subunit alcohol dehydrogenase family)